MKCDWLWKTDEEIFLNRHLIRLDKNEASLLETFCNEALEGIVEIGRMYGGSTYLVCESSSVPVVSIDMVNNVESALDLYNKHYQQFAESCLNGSMRLFNGLTRFVENNRLILINLPSQNVKLQHNYDVLFIDGDHEVEGVKLDIVNYWGNLTKYALFHDYQFSNDKGIEWAVDELIGSGCCNVIEQQGSMLAIEKTSEIPHSLLDRWYPYMEIICG